MTHTNPGLTDDHDNPADRIVTPGSVWRHHSGRLYRVGAIGNKTGDGRLMLNYQNMQTGSVHFHYVEDFLGYSEKQPGVLRFTRVEE